MKYIARFSKLRPSIMIFLSFISFFVGLTSSSVSASQDFFDTTEEFKAMRVPFLEESKVELAEVLDKRSLNVKDGTTIIKSKKRRGCCWGFFSWLCSYRSSVVDDKVEEGDFLEAFADNHVFEAEKHPARETVAKFFGYTFSAAAATVFGWQAYLFIKEFSSSPSLSYGLGSTLGIISFLPPLMGFSRLITSNLKDFFFLGRTFNNYASPCLAQNVMGAFVRFVPTVITTAPIVFVAYKSMNPVIHGASHFFELSVFLGLFSYYDKTTKAFVKNTTRMLNSFFNNNMKKNKFDKFPSTDLFLQKTPASEIISIRNNIITNPINGLQRLFLLYGAQKFSTEDKKCTCTRKSIVLIATSLLAVAGTSFFYVVNDDAVKEFLGKTSISKEAKSDVAILIGVISFLCRGMFNVQTSIKSTVSLMESFSSKATHGNKLANGAITGAKVFVSAVGSIPSTQISLEYLGHTPIGIIIALSTFETVFLANIWALDLQIKKLMQSKLEDDKEFLGSILSKMEEVFPLLHPRKQEYLNRLLEGRSSSN